MISDFCISHPFNNINLFTFIMALLSRSLAGRKKESGIWEYFKYCETTDKICLDEI